MNLKIDKMILKGLTIPCAIILILGMIIIPLPPLALDLLFITNIVVAMSVLMAAVFAKKPLEFSIFPTVLLIATMLRLSLNIASTRVILMNGHNGSGASGQIIESFGNFVVGGNFVIGVIVFTILTIINFVVITKGAERISEVGARFTLDAMPGKQMAIDADVGTGSITQEEAAIKRSELSQESQFYGAMDGASKFVKGDSIAGILILLINIVGGITIGTAQQGMSFGEAIETYLLLSIGDGLVAILPSIIMALATAIITTKVSNNTELTEMIRTQFGTNHMIAIMTGFIVCCVGLIPAMPNFLFLTIGSALIFAGMRIKKANEEVALEELVRSEEEELSESKTQNSSEVTIEDISEHDNIKLEIGYGLTELVKSESSPLMQAIRSARKDLSTQFGILIKGFRVVSNFQLEQNEYNIYVQGLPFGGGQVYANLLMAIGDPDCRPLDGIPAKDPALGLDGYWIMESQVAEAEELGYEVIEPTQIISTHMTLILMRHLEALIDMDDLQKLINRLEESKPKLVSAAIKDDQALVTLLRVIKTLLHERVPVCQLSMILESVAEMQGYANVSFDGLMFEVRKKLMPWIIDGILEDAVDKDSLKVIMFAPELEKQIVNGKQPNGQMIIDPAKIESMHKHVKEASAVLSDMQYPTVILVSSVIRKEVYDLLAPACNDVHVLSVQELGATHSIEIVSQIA